MSEQPNALSEDHFLGGKLRLLQPRAGYRAGVDPVLLAAAIPARPGERVLDLGCGVGAVALCLGRRVPGVDLTGVDLLDDNVALARRNASLNGIAMAVLQGDVAALPDDIRRHSYDHVLANPPYFRRDCGPAAAGHHRDTAMGEGAPLPLWIDCAIRRLGPKGRLTMILPAQRLPEALEHAAPRLGDLAVLPIAGRAGRAATRILLTGRKQSRAPFRLLAPLILHAGPKHLSDAEDYTQEVQAVLRDGAALSLD